MWPEVAPLFERAIERADSWDTMASLRADVDKGNTVLWLICDRTSLVAAFITGVVTSGRGRLLNAVILGGSRMSEWFVQFEAKLRDIAKSREWAGRKWDVEDWKRLLTAAWLRARGGHPVVVPAVDGAGFDVLYRRTSELSKAEMTGLIEYVHAWCATEAA